MHEVSRRALGSSTRPDGAGARANAPVPVAFRALQGRRRPDCIFSELNSPPRLSPVQRKTRGRADRYSLLVRLFHPLLHAGLARRTVIDFSPVDISHWGFLLVFARPD